MPPEMVEARIEGVEHNLETGWFKVKTSRGRFDTKIAEKAEEAISLKDHDVRLFFTTGQSSGRTNPHTGQPYPPPRWYERAERIGPSAGNGTSGIEQVSGKGMGRDDVWRICLSVGVKAAVDTMPLMPVDQRTFQIQQEIAMAWGRFLFFSAAPDLGAPTPPATSEEAFRPFAGVTEDAPSHDAPPPHTDDDIPY